ncbi:MAG TPA: hypothetical protein VES21_00885 [Nocardioidaceae bacterium]|nr:hypothetical protein [Nocardioidaceae bacterium]
MKPQDGMDEALELQTALKADLVASGEQDPFVDEELAPLTDGGRR